MIYTPADIKWIKNITDPGGRHAYMIPDDEFTLHVPTSSRDNASSAAVNEIIALYQKIDDNPCFTHLVTPIDDVLIDEKGGRNYRPQFRYGRRVKVIAITPVNRAIPRQITPWQSVNFRGISQGNVCEISHIKDIEQIGNLKLDLWNRFAKYLTASNDESRYVNEAIFNELELSEPETSAIEGRLLLASHFIRERNKEIVKRRKKNAIKNNTLICEVCDFSFIQKYNVNFIECHHIEPIGNGRVRDTREEDLALVCPNCHRMLHRKFDSRYLSIIELKQKFHS